MNRRAASSLGCLFTLLLVSAVIYFGVHAAESYWRYFKFQDGMRQEVKFAGRKTDREIVHRLRSLADSLELPDEAFDIYVARRGDSIFVDTEYEARIEMPFFVRTVRFHPRAAGVF